MELRQRKNVMVYAAGGAGTNVAAKLLQYIDHNDPGFAGLNICFADTSDSNLSKDIPEDKCYIIEGLDGSGKVRAENHKEISKRTRDILQKFKPSDLNIVLSSAAGGSGSVIAPSLVGELLAKNCPVIVISIGSVQTRLEIENTLKTLKSYEAIAKMRSAPVVLAYLQNDSKTSRTQVDATIDYLITSLCGLFSGQNRELDSKDLANWLRFDRVTSFPIGLTSLTIVRGEDNQTTGHVITVATIVEGEENSEYVGRDKIVPEYQCVGYSPIPKDKKGKDSGPTHFVVTQGELLGFTKKLEQTLQQFSDAREARVDIVSILSSDDEVTSDGMVL